MKEARILTTFVQQLLERNHLPVHVVNPPCEDPSWLDHGLRKTILNMDKAAEAANQIFDQIQPNTIYYITDNLECNYVFMRLPDSEDLMVCGPVVTEQIDEVRLADILENLHIPDPLHDQIRDYYHALTFFPLKSVFLSFFTLLAENIFGKDNYRVLYTNFGELNEYYKNYSSCLRIPEKPFLSIQIIEDRYQLESDLIESVISGNESKALEIHTRLISCLMPPRLANALRDHKDYCITLNTLLRKAVQAAGVHPIHIDTCSNRNVQDIEHLTSIEQCHNLQQKIIQSYCQLVRAYTLKNYSLLTQKVITYIETDLSANLSLKSLSEALSVNASYLSTLFKKEMGVPLTDYVNHRRIQHAQRLLLGTDLPIKVIAQQCGISDIHYFSRLFKQIAGAPPKVYRETATFDHFQSLSGHNQ